MAILARFAFASGVDTTTLLALRFSLAAVVMLAVLRARGLPLPRGSTLGVLIALGAAGYGGQAICYFTALKLAPAGLAALLLYLHPALVAVLAAAFLHERLNATKLVALAVALAGTVLTVGPAIGGDKLALAPRPPGRTRVRRGIGGVLRGLHHRGVVGRPPCRCDADEHRGDRQRRDGIRHRHAHPRAAVARDRSRMARGGRNCAALDRAGDHACSSPASSGSARCALPRCRRSSRFAPWCWPHGCSTSRWRRCRSPAAPSSSRRPC